METKNERQIQNEFHRQHPLVFVEEQSNEGHCSACGDLLSGPCFTCALCNYPLHQKCAEALLEIGNHPLHPHHSGFFLRQRPEPDSDDVYGCALSKEKRNIFFYECYDCYFSLDVKCFHSSSSYSKVNQESKHDLLQHPLTFIQSPIGEQNTSYCSSCHQPLLDALYLYLDCPLIFHKKCLDQSNKLKHPSHPVYPLFLESKENLIFCKLCQKQHSGYFYSSSLCPFNINIECAWPRSVVEDERHHQHPFTLFWRQGSLVCDVCDTEGKYISYICSTCVMVHKDCTKLPRILKFSRHVHCLFHKYVLELTRQDCMICFEQVKVERGSYSCVKAGCNYVVHVNCALQDDRLYEVIEQEYQCEELYAATQSSISRVIEENEDGEATNIQHFSHEGHCLVLADKMEEETDRKCDGCMLPVSTLLYYCSESDCCLFSQKLC